MSKNSIMSNFLWRFFERIGAKGVEFLVTIILARILAPDVYGSIALITVFITILQVFVDSGLGTALIQKKDADDLDFSTVFIFNILFCLLIYVVVFFTSPIVASFYNDPQLTSVIRVVGITILISGVKNIQQAYISRNMLFRIFFFATLIGTVCAAVIGITMALLGGGIWALALQQVSNVFIDTVMLWFLVKWRPKLQFSFYRLKELYNFGWKILASQLLETGYNQLRQLLIGKMYSSASLAYYNRAQQFPQFITANVNTSINSVLLPALSSEQDDKQRVKQMTRKAMMTSTYIMAPLMMGLAFAAEPVVRIVLTDKWLPCVPFMRIFCVTFLFYPIHTANLNAIKAMGRSDLFLRLEIYKKVVGLILLFATIWISVEAMAYSLLVSSLISQIINSSPNKKILDYGYLEQLRDIIPSILLSLFMGICVFVIQLLKMNDLTTLVIQIVIGGIIYFVGSRLIKLEPYIFLKNTLKSVISRKKENSNG